MLRVAHTENLLFDWIRRCYDTYAKLRPWSNVLNEKERRLTVTLHEKQDFLLLDSRARKQSLIACSIGVLSSAEGYPSSEFYV